MQFQKKMVVLYAIFGLLTAILLGGGYYAISVRQNIQEECQNVEFLAELYRQQWDEYIKPMESIMSYILSSPEVLESLQNLAVSQPTDSEDSAERKKARQILINTLNSDYILKNFYRVILFNKYGIVNASENLGGKLVHGSTSIDDIPWIEKVSNQRGCNIFIGKHTDNWGAKKSPKVFSLVKEVQGMQMGYIEVQRTVDELEQVFQIAGNSIQLLIIDGNNEVLYAGNSYQNNEFYCNYAKTEENGTKIVTNTGSGEREVIAVSHALHTDTTILVVSNLKSAMDKSFYILPITVALAGVFFVFSFIYTWVVSGHLTKPIRQLREFMENTHMENIKEEHQLMTTNNEIELLNQSYRSVLLRLDKAVQKEKQMSLLQLQAHFDLLQAQVNPHFLFNVLNVISSKGIMIEDDEICEICGCLAKMLRYSTSTKERYATIQEELLYVEQYFYLLKFRYEHRLEYKISVDEKIHDQLLPKIVLQQIVENSINHGYRNTSRNMKIHVEGGREDGLWYIKVIDNGIGFSDEIKQQLGDKLERIKEKILYEKNTIEMGIGGMGIVNTYARLFLVYHESLKFEFRNLSEGTEVLIAAPIEEKGVNDV